MRMHNPQKGPWWCDVREAPVRSVGADIPKVFLGETIAWKRLMHPNVVPFLVVTETPLQLVSEWVSNGTLTEYVNRGADKVRLVCGPSPCAFS